MAWVREWVHELGSETHLDIGCFLAGTQITMDYGGKKNIEYIAEKDKVVSAEGNIRKVVDTFRRKYKGWLYTLSSFYGYSVEATEEHPVLAIKGGSPVLESSMGYVEAKNLRVGDYMAVPKVKGKSHKYSDDELFIFGWYLAEGSVIYSHKPQVCGINLTLSIDENEVATQLINAANRLGYNTGVSVREKKSTIDVRIYSKDFTEMILSLFGRYSHSKYLPENVLTWDADSKTRLLSGLFLGDGHLRTVKNGGEQYTLTTVSPKLAEGVQDVLRSLGVLTYHYTHERTERHNMHLIVITGTDINKLIPGHVKYTSKSRIKETERFSWVPVTQVQKREINEEVYNFEVDVDNSYVADNIGVHNCKDGYTCLTLQAEGVDCTGIDPSEDAIEEARTKAETAKLDCTFIVGYGEDIPDTIRVDTLSIMEVLEHVVNPNKLLEVASRTAMYVMITTPDVNGRHGMKDAERNQEHVRLYSKKELEKLCSKYGTIKESVIKDDQLQIIIKPK